MWEGIHLAKEEESMLCSVGEEEVYVQKWADFQRGIWELIYVVTLMPFNIANNILPSVDYI